MRKFDEISVPEAEKLTKEQLLYIGKKLKELRITNNLTLNDIGFYLYSNISTVEKLELGKAGNVTLLTLMKFSVFYDIPIKEFFC